MSTWLTEREFRQSGAEASGVTLNVPFLREIKEDNLPVRKQTSILKDRFSKSEMNAREAAESLSRYRDSLETYFALEEFYGYFRNASIVNPNLSPQVSDLRDEHAELFLKLNQLIEVAEQIVYHECSPQTTLDEVAKQFGQFANHLEMHEQREMDLMMRFCNEELGVGD